MPESMSFAEGFLGIQAKQAASKGARFRVFDWNKAAQLIKEALKKTPHLIAEAGLDGDWSCTGGEIFNEGQPVPQEETYTFLASNWATPTLIIDGVEIDCWVFEDESEFKYDTYWPESALAILNA